RRAARCRRRPARGIGRRRNRCAPLPRRGSRCRTRPRLEALEDRALPSTVTWDGGGATSNWFDRFNWVNDVLPVAGDDLVFPAGAAHLTSVNDSLSDTLFNSLTFSGSRRVIFVASLSQPRYVAQL